MGNRIYEIYNNEILNISKDNNTEIIFLVGSSKNVHFGKEDIKVNDFDIFVIVSNLDGQRRIIKNIDGIEFDINYFSKEKVKNLINSKELFFIKELSDPKVLYDKTKESNEIIAICKEKLKEGPNILDHEEICFLKYQIKSNIDRLISNNIDTFEYEFLTNLYLKDIIVGYFSINGKWIPKDKKLFDALKIENMTLFMLVKKTLETKNHKDLLSVYDYTFNNIQLNKTIKISY